jgi:hypothetical protein
VIEFYGNEFGDWFFHYHLLYHMKSGMARVISSIMMVINRIRKLFPMQPNIFKESWYVWGEADVLSKL